MKKTILLFVVFLMAGGFLGAQDGGFTPEELALASASTDPPMELSVPEGSTGSPYWYGTTGRFWISGSAAGNCQPTSSTLTWSQNFGYYNGSSGSTTFWNCALQAPTGALIGGFEVTTQDSDATDDICAYFWRFPVKSTTATVVGDGCTSGTGDTSIWVVGLDETIENHWHHYLVRVVLNSGTSTNRFRGIFFSTNRQISPAPGSPSFPDVAPGYWAYQEIEALAASGITTGYPDGTFKPTAAVTRAQMATFLARALGLHWGD